MKFHIATSLSKSISFAKFSVIPLLALSCLAAACKEEPPSEKTSTPQTEQNKSDPLEEEIERMLLTQKDDPEALVKLVKGKPWKELLESCMRVEKSLDPQPSKNRIAWARFKVRGAFYEASTEEHTKQKEENLKKIEALLREMAKEEGLLPK